MNARLPTIAKDGATPASLTPPARTTRALVSVRNVEEALLAARAGVTLIDLKEPRDGALGGLPPEAVKQVVEALRAQGFSGEISATIGDHAATALREISARIDALAGTGVDVIKVGVAPDLHGSGASLALLERLAARAERGLKLVPVLIADQGLHVLPVAEALTEPFHAVMLDTEDKSGGPLPARLGMKVLKDFVQQAHADGRRCGLAGALRLDDLPMLVKVAPADFFGFRSAVCRNGRVGALDPGLLRSLCELSAAILPQV